MTGADGNCRFDHFAMIATPRYFNGRAASIYGGSNEIQRGIIARQLLGL